MSEDNPVTPNGVLQILVEAIRENPHRPAISDLHIHSHTPMRGRFRGRLRTLVRCPDKSPCPTLSAKQVQQLIEAMIGEHRPWLLQRYRQHGGADFAYALALDGQVFRFRVNAFRTLRGPALTIRAIPQQVPSLTELGLPEKRLRELLLTRPHGLFLVVGATGSGKSTTLAAVLDRFNRPRGEEERHLVGGRHIVTIEDPIEYVFTSGQALVSQRELGAHVPSFGEGLRQALRQDPDIIMVGEIRDSETADTALGAARTGHLVLSTLHTGESISTLTRLLSFFPPEEEREIRNSLAETLIGVLSQRLVPRANGERVLIYELLEVTSHVRDLIAQGRFDELRQLARDTGRDLGYGPLVTFDYTLAEKVAAGVIGYEEALPHASSPTNFKHHLRTLQHRAETGEWQPEEAAG